MRDDGKTYLDLTDEERKERGKLTPKEQKAMDEFLAAAKKLPASLTIDVDDDGDPGHLLVRKRITRGSCVLVGSVKKKSLVFG